MGLARFPPEIIRNAPSPARMSETTLRRGVTEVFLTKCSSLHLSPQERFLGPLKARRFSFLRPR
jgi:hypothetical protein